MFEFLQYPFMRDAMVNGMLIATLCALLSGHIHYKSQAMMSDGISHAMLLGLVLAVMSGVPLIFGAFFAAIACVLLTRLIRHFTRLNADTALGISYTTLFAIGLLLYYHHSNGQHLLHILFGNLLGIPEASKQRILYTAIVLIPLLLLSQRVLLLTLYDPSQARLSGLSPRLIDIAMLIALAFTASAAIEGVGIILTVAMLISPALTARLITRRYYPMQIIAVLSAWLSTLLGIIISFHFDTASGATIVLCQSAQFLLLFLFHQFRTCKKA